MVIKYLKLIIATHDNNINIPYTNPPTTHVICMANIKTPVDKNNKSRRGKNGAFKVSEKRRVILPSVWCLQNRHRWPTDRSGLNTTIRESLLHNYPLSWSLRYSQPRPFFFFARFCLQRFLFYNYDNDIRWSWVGHYYPGFKETGWGIFLKVGIRSTQGSKWQALELSFQFKEA